MTDRPTFKDHDYFMKDKTAYNSRAVFEEHVRHTNDKTRELRDDTEELQAQTEVLHQEMRDYHGELDAVIEGNLIQTKVDERVEQKYNDLDEEYNTQLNGLTAQLAQKVGGGTKAELEDLSENVLNAIDGEGGPFDLLTIPQNDSVTLEKLAPSLRESQLVSYNNKTWTYKLEVVNGTVNLILKELPKFSSIDDIAYENLTLREIFEGNVISLESANPIGIEDVEVSNSWLNGTTTSNDMAYYVFPKTLTAGKRYIISFEFRVTGSREFVHSSAHPTVVNFDQQPVESEFGFYYDHKEMNVDKVSVRTTFSRAGGKAGDVVGVKDLFIINTNIFENIPTREMFEELKWYYVSIKRGEL